MDRPPTIGDGWPRRTLALVTVTCVVVIASACGSAPTDSSTGVTDSTKAELGAVLKAREGAIARGDLKAFETTFDTTRLTFRRWQSAEFAEAAKLGPRLFGNVVDVQPYLDRYVRAWVEESNERAGWPKGVNLTRLYFRREAGRWLLTEPRADELGGERTKTVGTHTFTYYGLDDDIADLFLAEYRSAHELVAKLSPMPLSADFNTRLIPTAEVAGPGSLANRATTYDRAGFALFPWAISVDPTRTKLSGVTQFEYRVSSVSWMREQVLPGIRVRIEQAPWLLEGWEQHQAWVGPRTFYQPVCAGVSALTLKQLTDGPPPPESPATTIEIYSQYYTYTRTMGEYFDATFGLAAYWDLLKAFVPSADAKANMVKVLLVTPEQFYASWLVWAKKKYC